MPKHAKPGSGILAALAPYRKSLYPLGAALAGLVAACLPFTDGGSTVTNAEWSAFGAAIAAAGVTWVAPRNKPKPKPPADRVRQRNADKGLT